MAEQNGTVLLTLPMVGVFAVVDQMYPFWAVASSSYRILFFACMRAQSYPTLSDPMDYRPTRLLCPWGFSRQEYWIGLPCPPPGDLPTQGSNPVSTVQVDSLPAEPPGKAKNTGVGSLSLFQGIFPTQESNWGLLRCRCILYAKLPGKPELVGT